MYEQDNLKFIISVMWHLAKPLIYVVMLCTFVAVIYDEYFRPQSVPPQTSHWKNYDPTKNATDIAELDYENRLIHYREYRTEGESDSIYSNKAVPTSTDDGFYDWYDVDYYDLYDYYHD